MPTHSGHGSPFFLGWSSINLGSNSQAETETVRDTNLCWTSYAALSAKCRAKIQPCDARRSSQQVTLSWFEFPFFSSCSETTVVAHKINKDSHFFRLFDTHLLRVSSRLTSVLSKKRWNRRNLWTESGASHHVKAGCSGYVQKGAAARIYLERVTCSIKAEGGRVCLNIGYHSDFPHWMAIVRIYPIFRHVQVFCRTLQRSSSVKCRLKSFEHGSGASWASLCTLFLAASLFRRADDSWISNELAILLIKHQIHPCCGV